MASRDFVSSQKKVLVAPEWNVWACAWVGACVSSCCIWALAALPGSLERQQPPFFFFLWREQLAAARRLWDYGERRCRGTAALQSAKGRPQFMLLRKSDMHDWEALHVHNYARVCLRLCSQSPGLHLRPRSCLDGQRL